MDCLSEPHSHNAPGGDVKSRNRLAQQKYRERKKEKRNELAAQVAELSRRLAAAQCTRDGLADRNKALEALADPSLPDPQAEVQEVTSTSNFPSCFADYLNAIHRHRQPLVTAADVLEHTMDPIEYRTIKMDFGRNLTQIAASAPELTPEVIAELEKYVTEVRGTKSKAVECYTGATRPTNERSNGKKIHTAPELHPLAATLIPAMSPTDEQLQALQTVRQEHEKQMGVLKAERQVILERIQKIEGGTTSEASSVYEGLNAAEEANEALGENLRQEWQSMYERNEACNAVVSPLQEALMALKGYRNGIWIEIWDVPNLLDKNAVCSDVHGNIDPLRMHKDAAANFENRIYYANQSLDSAGQFFAC